MSAWHLCKIAWTFFFLIAAVAVIFALQWLSHFGPEWMCDIYDGKRLGVASGTALGGLALAGLCVFLSTCPWSGLFEEER